MKIMILLLKVHVSKDSYINISPLDAFRLMSVINALPLEI